MTSTVVEKPINSASGVIDFKNEKNLLKARVPEPQIGIALALTVGTASDLRFGAVTLTHAAARD